ncbi:hypothetical protein [Nitrosomonas sp. Nm34]|uniref:hypothetical protein n=1 Tax=Nitrosomonas sp. Nm34 TaxID=1881055 RepID=UPI0008E26045|nr:hypothetical protein [Nitrosomonas sp. Nm34]SFI39816.1 hypothetical protein SAMN05428978_100866 [Nitrosomonas sp. Nm34]
MTKEVTSKEFKEKSKEKQKLSGLETVFEGYSLSSEEKLPALETVFGRHSQEKKDIKEDQY